MPVHFEIQYGSSSVPSACVGHVSSEPLEVETSYPDWFNHSPGGGPQNVDTITVIFSKDRLGNYPQDVTIACWATHEDILVNSPTGSSTHSSSVSVINYSGQSCEIRVTCTGSDSTEETWQFENSHCVDETGQEVPCPAMEKGKTTPSQLKVKVKRQPSYSCPT
jgi:hypothetical protein